MAWKYALVQMMKKNENLLYSDDEIAIIKDCYPKAELHYLALPKINISSIKSVSKEHIDLLKKMDLKAKEFVRENGEGRTFKYGYHSQPSMERLHLHIVSDDFDSPCLKHAKHWNSFNTPFFIESTKAIYDLESLGKVKLPSSNECSAYLRTPLKCHKCIFKPKNFPALKKHLKEDHNKKGVTNEESQGS